MAELFQVAEENMEEFRLLLTERMEREWKVNPDILAVGAADRSEACGLMLIRVAEDALTILYLVVADAYRRRGIGTELLNLATDMAYQSEKLLFAPFYAENEETALYRLFQNDHGILVEETESVVYRVPVQELVTVGENLPKSKGKCKIVHFTELTEEEKNDFFRKSDEEGVSYFDLNCPDYLSPLCLAAKKEDKLKAVLLTKKGGSEDEIMLDYVYSSDPQALVELLRKAAEIALSLSKTIHFVKVVSVNEESQKLIDSLLPSAEKTGACYMATLDF